MYSLSLFITVIFVHSSLQIDRLFENDICQNKDGVQGFCKKLDDCSTGIVAIKAGKPPKICSFVGDHPVVCCPPETVTNTQQGSSGRPSQPNNSAGVVNSSKNSPAAEKAREKCKEYAKSVLVKIGSPALGSSATEIVDLCARIEEPLIVGGQETRPREFPHMALIGYKEKDIEWLCGGSLISERFVLSAAHCSRPSRKGPALWAKLGELDTSSDYDEAQPQIIRIIQRYDHPEYSSVTLYNDISLFKLERNVVFDAFIRPICLSTDDAIPSPTAIATGWGHIFWGGPGSPRMMKVKLNLVKNSDCNDKYKGSVGRAIPQGILDESMVCAGDLIGKDTCQGDSGGPLQIAIKEPYCMYDIVGLTSFGKSCGSGYPGIYTRISHFLPWIVQIVWPE